MKVAFTAILPDNFVTDVNEDTPEEVKDVHNTQRNNLFEDLKFRLQQPDISWDKKLIHVATQSNLSEIEKFLKHCNLTISKPILNKHSDIEAYVVLDERSGELQLRPSTKYEA